jgi:hypothetical protein
MLLIPTTFTPDIPRRRADRSVDTVVSTETFNCANPNFQASAVQGGTANSDSISRLRVKWRHRHAEKNK